MTDYREQVNAEVIHRDWNLPNRLAASVDEDAALASDARDLLDRLDRSDLVVRMHDRHEHRTR